MSSDKIYTYDRYTRKGNKYKQIIKAKSGKNKKYCLANDDLEAIIECINLLKEEYGKTKAYELIAAEFDISSRTLRNRVREYKLQRTECLTINVLVDDILFYILGNLDIMYILSFRTTNKRFSIKCLDNRLFRILLLRDFNINLDIGYHENREFEVYRFNYIMSHLEAAHIKVKKEKPTLYFIEVYPLEYDINLIKENVFVIKPYKVNLKDIHLKYANEQSKANIISIITKRYYDKTSKCYFCGGNIEKQQTTKSKENKGRYYWKCTTCNNFVAWADSEIDYSY